jgi:hypothetical protein
MTLIEAAAAAALALMRAWSKRGIAMATITRITATTINNSITLKPASLDLAIFRDLLIYRWAIIR